MINNSFSSDIINVNIYANEKASFVIENMTLENKLLKDSRLFEFE